MNIPRDTSVMTLAHGGGNMSMWKSYVRASVLVFFILGPVVPLQAQTYPDTYGSIPPDARVRITYEGNLEGVVTVRDSSKNTRIGIRGININIGGTSNIPVQAAYHADVTYEGINVTGVERQTSGTRGASGSGTFRGTRNGDQCDLVTDDGRRFAALCTISQFSYKEDYTNPQKQHVRVQLSAQKTKYVDIAEQERLAAAAAAKQLADYNSYINKLPPAAKNRALLFQRILENDSRGWVSNHLDSHSVRNVRLEKRNSNGSAVIYGEYTLNGGSQGWMKANVTGQSVNCVEFFDFPGKCRPLGESPGQAIAGNMMGALISSMFSGDSSPSASGVGPCGAPQSVCEARAEKANANMYKQVPHTPTPPISSFYGNGPKY